MHIFKKFSNVLFLLLTTIFYSQAFGWWDQSHQMIGLIAGKNVSDVTNKKVLSLLREPLEFPGNALISQRTSGFDTAASWADVIKETNTDYNACHYIDLRLPKYLVGTTIDEQTAQHAFTEAMYSQNMNSVTCLKSFIKTLLDHSRTTTEKAVALRFVIHIIGDMAQPLHNAALLLDSGAEDDGGNKTYFPSFVNLAVTDGSSSRQNRLHALWDGSLGVFLQFPYTKEKNKTGVFDSADLQVNSCLSADLDTQQHVALLVEDMQKNEQKIENWVMDGYKIAAKYVYTDLDQTWGYYSVKRHDVIKTQIAKAGHRLAFILDAIFDPNNASEKFTAIVYGIKNDRSIQPFSLPPR